MLTRSTLSSSMHKEMKNNSKRNKQYCLKEHALVCVKLTSDCWDACCSSADLVARPRGGCRGWCDGHICTVLGGRAGASGAVCICKPAIAT